MHHVEAAGHPGLVRLQVADEVPADVEIGGPIHFLERFLNFVFAEIDLPGFGGDANEFHGKRLGDGDEANSGGVATGPAGSPRDSNADISQPGSERSGVWHYFFGNEPKTAFAVAALGPSGASLR
jgi:hypothetical protein